jgi:NADH:ubiquinone oxidoreductase subunit 6 (subunit J)
MPDLIGTILFTLFSLGALGFSCVLVAQRNPARGALAFSFVILSTCGLFLLLAAPFLMAATVIIYAGAIIVTFLFVLMLSQPKGESNENDRSREPLLGSLAGFAFVGLVLFTLYLTALSKDEVMGETESTASSKSESRLPAPMLTNQERQVLSDVITKLKAADDQLGGDLSKGNNERLDYFEGIKRSLNQVVGSHDEKVGVVEDGSIRKRLEKAPGRAGGGAILYREDQQARAIHQRTAGIRELNWKVYHLVENLLIDKKTDVATVKGEVEKLRDQVILLYGSVELPARNVENLGYLLYADHLLAIELAGTLLLVATIGAIAIAQRKGLPT